MHVDERALVRMAADGRTEVLIGTMSNGQGHETVFAQLAAETLGCAADDVTVIQGDTDRIATGNGTGASRSLTVGGSALLLACRRHRRTGDAPRPVNCFRPTPKLSNLAPAGFASRARSGWRPGKRSRIIATVSPRSIASIPTTTPSQPGVTSARWKSIPIPGVVTLVAYAMVHDVGRAVNASVVTGQLQGGVTQGIGQALMEEVRYDTNGQVINGSFLDYEIPRADRIPSFRTALAGIPSTVNPLGAKSVGEAGPTAAPPAVINAVLDALAPLGIEHVEMPATPASIWRAIRSADQR